MSPIFCSKGHANSVDSRFCRFCGEQMVARSARETSHADDPKQPPINKPLIGLRYRIVQQLGHGGFGRTYLAEDEQRFREQCVLKEFAPKVEGPEAIRKAESLFEREAGVLYRLRHTQIPRFRELLKAEFEGRDRLFLVQDYIEGPTYQELLDKRWQQGRCFSEPEILQFLSQILPVLDYIHRMGVIHRDIAPDNLIFRNDDQHPVLIDFGGVKQAAATIESELRRSPQQVQEVTLVGKQGFAPREQMQEGRVKPHCDLYALAVTILVLMTGQSPNNLLNPDATTYWERQITGQGNVGPLLRSVLKQMLSRPESRYPSAPQVMDALGLLRISAQSPDAVSASGNADNGHPAAARINPVPPRSVAAPQKPAAAAHTVAVSPGVSQQHPQQHRSQTTHPASRPIYQIPSAEPVQSSGWWRGVLAFVTILALAGVGGWVGYQWVPQWLNLEQDGETVSDIAEQEDESGGDLDTASSRFSPDEQARKAALQSRRDRLGINASFLVTLTDARFFEEYPRQQGRSLTDAPNDAVWRERWDAIASDWLDTLETTLSEGARRKLGSYSQPDRDQWKQAVNRFYVSSNALYDLADAQFFYQFPDQRNQSFIDQPIGQVWHGIAADQVQAMQTGSNLQEIQFAAEASSHEISGELSPGSGQIYTLNLSEDQRMRLEVDAPRGDVRLSIYIPQPTDELPFLLEDSRSLDWSGRLPQSGYYEVAIVSVANQATRFHLDVAVEN